jgi:hypothetical protein
LIYPCPLSSRESFSFPHGGSGWRGARGEVIFCQPF